MTGWVQPPSSPGALAPGSRSPAPDVLAICHFLAHMRGPSRVLLSSLSSLRHLSRTHPESCSLPRTRMAHPRSPRARRRPHTPAPDPSCSASGRPWAPAVIPVPAAGPGACACRVVTPHVPRSPAVCSTRQLPRKGPRRAFLSLLNLLASPIGGVSDVVTPAPHLGPPSAALPSATGHRDRLCSPARSPWSLFPFMARLLQRS